MFIRKQLSAYCIAVEVKRTFPITYTDEEVLPAMKFSGPAPHWRHDLNCWGPDEFGYTEFDDYHLAIYGA